MLGKQAICQQSYISSLTGNIFRSTLSLLASGLGSSKCLTATVIPPSFQSIHFWYMDSDTAVRHTFHPWNAWGAASGFISIESYPWCTSPWSPVGAVSVSPAPSSIIFLCSLWQNKGGKRVKGFIPASWTGALFRLRWDNRSVLHEWATWKLRDALLGKQHPLIM